MPRPTLWSGNRPVSSGETHATSPRKSGTASRKTRSTAVRSSRASACSRAASQARIVVCVGRSGDPVPLKVTKLQIYEGMQLKEIEEVQPGDIVVLAGIDDVEIGDTICTQLDPRALPRI